MQEAAKKKKEEGTLAIAQVRRDKGKCDKEKKEEGTLAGKCEKEASATRKEGRRHPRLILTDSNQFKKTAGASPAVFLFPDRLRFPAIYLRHDRSRLWSD